MQEDSWILRERRWLNALGLLLVMCAVLLAAREYVLTSIADDWPSQQHEVNASQVRTIGNRVEDLARDLRAAGEELLKETEIRTGSPDIPAARLIARMRDYPYSFEWRDGGGDLLAYTGEPIRRGLPESPVRPVTVIDRTPYHLLVVTLPGRNPGESMAVAKPLAPSVPASRRILQIGRAHV